MRRRAWLLAVAFLSTIGSATDISQPVLPLPCTSTGSACQPSKADLKKAKTAFSKGLQLEKKKRLDEAFAEFDTAARLAPTNLDYGTALALVRQQLVADHVRQGNAALVKGQQIEAQAEFRSAVTLDPDNLFAQQRLRESVGEWLPRNTPVVQVVEDAGELRVVPKEARQTFHFRGDSHTLLTQVAGAYGVAVELDESVVSRRVHFDIENVDFYVAMRAAGDVTGTFWTPLSEKQVLVARDTTENHRRFDRMALRGFRLSAINTAQEANQILGLLRVVFEIRFVQQRDQGREFVVRAPVHVLDAVARCLEGFDRGRPQVILDVDVYQIDHQLARNIGLHIPNNFNLFNIPAAAFAALGGQNLQDLINSLISSGGINQANSQAISGLISQLQGQQGGIFSQPLATFGGGLTLMGLSLDNIAAQLSLNESWVKILDHATLRAAEGSDTTFRLGSRYPVVNASFAPIFNSSAISQVLQNGSFQAPIPSFSYEDLGLDVKAKPAISSDSSVGLNLELRLRSLAGQSINGVPVIANREYKGSINLENGEQAVVASELSQSEMLTLTGVPGLGSIPGLKHLATVNNKTAEADELLLVITPHIVDLESGQNAEVWLHD